MIYEKLRTDDSLCEVVSLGNECLVLGGVWTALREGWGGETGHPCLVIRLTHSTLTTAGMHTN